MTSVKEDKASLFLSGFMTSPSSWDEVMALGGDDRATSKDSRCGEVGVMTSPRIGGLFANTECSRAPEPVKCSGYRFETWLI